jgi:hypothetical protein
MYKKVLSAYASALSGKAIIAMLNVRPNRKTIRRAEREPDSGHVEWPREAERDRG